MRSTSLVLGLIFPFIVTACGGDPGKGAPKAEAPKADAPKADAPKAEAPKVAEKEPIEMVEHDLSSADAAWAGWVAQGPKGAKLMQDGVQGARIAASKSHGFDLAFAPKKTDLANLKANLQKGEASSEGKSKLTFTTDTADALEWTNEGYGAVKYNFVHNMTVGDREVSCKNNYMVGIDSAELRTRHIEACKSLQKKG